MKNKLILFIILLLSVSSILAQDRLPPINQRIIDYVDGVIGNRVGRGECWDLADQALISSGAQFDKSSEVTLYIFGREYDPREESIFPGDIIQFKKVLVKYQKGNVILSEKMVHHTAIVYDVTDNRKLQLAHQNTSKTGKKVGITSLDLSHVRKGELRFYRPIPDR
jgi:hypothetical protein